jgi:Putative peptidoglycan binding domain
MIRSSRLFQFAALLLFGSLALFAAPRLDQARKLPAHQARRSRHSIRFSRSRYHRAYYRRSRHHRAMLPASPTTDRIEQIQGALGRAGYYKDDPSGRWDPNTVEAMKRFQQDQGLQPNGKIDARTLQKLGLGSDVAGLGAPHRPPPAPLEASSNVAPTGRGVAATPSPHPAPAPAPSPKAAAQPNP